MPPGPSSLTPGAAGPFLGPGGANARGLTPSVNPKQVSLKRPRLSAGDAADLASSLTRTQGPDASVNASSSDANRKLISYNFDVPRFARNVRAREQPLFALALELPERHDHAELKRLRRDAEGKRDIDQEAIVLFFDALRHAPLGQGPSLRPGLPPGVPAARGAAGSPGSASCVLSLVQINRILSGAGRLDALGASFSLQALGVGTGSGDGAQMAHAGAVYGETVCEDFWPFAISPHGVQASFVPNHNAPRRKKQIGDVLGFLEVRLKRRALQGHGYTLGVYNDNGLLLQGETPGAEGEGGENEIITQLLPFAAAPPDFGPEGVLAFLRLLAHDLPGFLPPAAPAPAPARALAAGGGAPARALLLAAEGGGARSMLRITIENVSDKVYRLEDGRIAGLSVFGKGLYRDVVDADDRTKVPYWIQGMKHIDNFNKSLSAHIAQGYDLKDAPAVHAANSGLYDIVTHGREYQIAVTENDVAWRDGSFNFTQGRIQGDNLGDCLYHSIVLSLRDYYGRLPEYLWQAGQIPKSSGDQDQIREYRGLVAVYMLAQLNKLDLDDLTTFVEGYPPEGNEYQTVTLERNDGPVPVYRVTPTRLGAQRSAESIRNPGFWYDALTDTANALLFNAFQGKMNIVVFDITGRRATKTSSYIKVTVYGQISDKFPTVYLVRKPNHYEALEKNYARKLLERRRVALPLNEETDDNYLLAMWTLAGIQGFNRDVAPTDAMKRETVERYNGHWAETGRGAVKKVVDAGLSEYSSNISSSSMHDIGDLELAAAFAQSVPGQETTAALRAALIEFKTHTKDHILTPREEEVVKQAEATIVNNSAKVPRITVARTETSTAAADRENVETLRRSAAQALRASLRASKAGRPRMRSVVADYVKWHLQNSEELLVALDAETLSYDEIEVSAKKVATTAAMLEEAAKRPYRADEKQLMLRLVAEGQQNVAAAKAVLTKLHAKIPPEAGRGAGDLDPAFAPPAAAVPGYAALGITPAAAPVEVLSPPPGLSLLLSPPGMEPRLKPSERPQSAPQPITLPPVPSTIPPRSKSFAVRKHITMTAEEREEFEQLRRMAPMLKTGQVTFRQLESVHEKMQNIFDAINADRDFMAYVAALIDAINELQSYIEETNLSVATKKKIEETIDFAHDVIKIATKLTQEEEDVPSPEEEGSAAEEEEEEEEDTGSFIHEEGGEITEDLEKWQKSSRAELEGGVPGYMLEPPRGWKAGKGLEPPRVTREPKRVLIAPVITAKPPEDSFTFVPAGSKLTVPPQPSQSPSLLPLQTSTVGDTTTWSYMPGGNVRTMDPNSGLPTRKTNPDDPVAAGRRPESMRKRQRQGWGLNPKIPNPSSAHSYVPPPPQPRVQVFPPEKSPSPDPQFPRVVRPGLVRGPAGMKLEPEASSEKPPPLRPGSTRLVSAPIVFPPPPPSPPRPTRKPIPEPEPSLPPASYISVRLHRVGTLNFDHDSMRISFADSLGRIRDESHASTILGFATNARRASSFGKVSVLLDPRDPICVSLPLPLPPLPPPTPQPSFHSQQ